MQTHKLKFVSSKMSQYVNSSSSRSSSTSENEVQVEVDDQCYDPGGELMLLILQQSRYIQEAYQSSNDMRRRRRLIQRNREVGHARSTMIISPQTQCIQIKYFEEDFECEESYSIT